MGMGILFAGLSGAGQGMAQSARDMQKFDDERSLMLERAKIDEERQLRIDEITRGRNREPLNRLQGLAQKFAQEEVPVVADPVKVSTSDGAKAAGLQDGLVGMSREQVMAYKNPDMLAQYDRQIVADQGIAQKGLLGAKRVLTSDEARDKAMDYAKVNDMEAYEAGNKNRKDDLAEKRADSQDKRWDAQNAHSDKSLNETIRHNKRLEDAALLRSGDDKLSPAARAQIEIARTNLFSAQKSEHEAGVALKAAQTAAQGDPSNQLVKEAQRDYAAAKIGVTNAISHYTQTGKAHLGEEWKDIETSKPAPSEPFDPNKFKSKTGTTASSSTPSTTSAPSKATRNGPQVGETRPNPSRGQGHKTQVYKATGRSGSNYEWVDQ